MFPVVGSCVLFGLYMLFKLFSKEYINMLLTGYFLLFGVAAVTTTLSPVFALVRPPAEGVKPWEYTIHFPWDKGVLHASLLHTQSLTVRCALHRRHSL